VNCPAEPAEHLELYCQRCWEDYCARGWWQLLSEIGKQIEGNNGDGLEQTERLGVGEREAGSVDQSGFGAGIGCEQRWLQQAVVDGEQQPGFAECPGDGQPVGGD
jgi:hypothetical protein